MDKKERIVRAALDSFLERGIQKTTIAHIVQGADIAQGTFYLYFPSKMALMPAIAEVMADKLLTTMKQSVDEDLPISEQLVQIIDAIFEVNETYHEVQALIYAGLASTEHLKKWESVYEPIYAYLRNWLWKAKVLKAVRPTVIEEDVSKLMIGLIESAAEQVYLYDEHKEEGARRQKRAVYELLQHALELQEEKEGYNG